MIIQTKNILNNVYIFIMCLCTMIRIISGSYLDTVLPFNFLKVMNIIETFACIILFLIFFMQKKISIKRLIITILLTIIMIIITIKVRDKSLLMTFLFIVSFPKNLDIDKLAKKLCFSNVLVILLIVLLSKLGLIFDYTFYQHNILRHSMGFVASNAFSNLVTLTIMLYIFYKKKNIKKHTLIILFLILLYVYHVSSSRLALFIGILNILFILFINKFEKNKFLKNKLFTLSKYLFVFLSLMCLFATFYFSNHKNALYSQLDELTTGRVSWINYYYNQYGISLLGKNIMTVGIRTSVEEGISWKNIDNSYILYSIKYGLIIIIVLSFGYIMLGKRIKKDNSYYEAIYIILICIFGLTESILLVSGYNYSLVFISKMLASNNMKGNLVENDS